MPYLGDTVTWLSNQHIDPDTPAGLCKALGIGADICLIGAKKLDAASSGWDLPDRQILGFHALELALKAFLAKHGLTRETLRKRLVADHLRRHGGVGEERSFDRLRVARRAQERKAVLVFDEQPMDILDAIVEMLGHRLPIPFRA
jgi:hypothetical protein